MRFPEEFEAKVELSHDTNAVYLKLSDKKIFKTKNILGAKCLILADYDAEGNVVGVELFGGKNLYECFNNDKKNE